MDDDGALLNKGKPMANSNSASGSGGTSSLPSLRERQLNYRTVAGSKYATAADLEAANATGTGDGSSGGGGSSSSISSNVNSRSS